MPAVRGSKRFSLGQSPPAATPAQLRRPSPDPSPQGTRGAALPAALPPCPQRLTRLRRGNSPSTMLITGMRSAAEMKSSSSISPRLCGKARMAETPCTTTVWQRLCRKETGSLLQEVPMGKGKLGRCQALKAAGREGLKRWITGFPLGTRFWDSPSPEHQP